MSNVLPKGYEVDISHVKDAPSKSVNIPEPMFEEASAGATSAGNIASTGNSPHIAAGTPAVLKRWSGEPGKMGKSIITSCHNSITTRNWNNILSFIL